MSVGNSTERRQAKCSFNRNSKLREVFRQTILNWLQRNFSELAEAKAAKAHPKIMSWFRAETKAQSRHKDDDLETLILSLNEQAKLPALFGQ